MKTDENGNEIYQGYTLVKPTSRGNPYRAISPTGANYPDAGMTREDARNFVKGIIAREIETAEKVQRKIAHDAHAPKQRERRIYTPLPAPAAPKVFPIRLHGSVAYAEKRNVAQAGKDADKVTDDKMFVRIVKAPRSPNYVGQFGIIDKSDILTAAQVAEYEERRHAHKIDRKERKRKRTSGPIRHGRKVA